MTRLHLTPVLALVLLALPMAAAGAADTTPPGTSAAGLEPAPLPDPDMLAPSQRASTDPSLQPSVFNQENQFRGDGFSPGSTSQSYEQRHYMPPAGLSLSVPLK